MPTNEELLSYLNKIRENAIQYGKAHRERFVYLERSLKYYKVPVLVLSAFSSAISLSQEFFSQSVITITNTILGLICSLIVSLELYLGISREMSQSESIAKDFYNLSTEIQKQLVTLKDKGQMDILPYMEAAYSQYTSLITNSTILNIDGINDKLIEIENEVPHRRTSIMSLFGRSSRQNSSLHDPYRKKSVFFGWSTKHSNQLIPVQQSQPFAVQHTPQFPVQQSQPFAVQQSQPFAAQQSHPFPAQHTPQFPVQQSQPFPVQQSQPFAVQQSQPFAVQQSQPFTVKNTGLPPLAQPTKIPPLENLQTNYSGRTPRKTLVSQSTSPKYQRKKTLNTNIFQTISERHNDDDDDDDDINRNGNSFSDASELSP